jgi:Leucine-rich repeat (LRR) protein
MELKYLWLMNSNVRSIAALKAMPLVSLWLTDCPVADLSPLQDMKTLQVLSISGTEVSDLTPLRKIPLSKLYCEKTKVSSIEPLKGDRVQYLNLQECPLSNVEPIKEMPELRVLGIAGTQVKDLAPLSACQKLGALSIPDPKTVTGLEAIRSLPLAKIAIVPWRPYVSNRMTPEDFWRLLADPSYEPRYYDR